MNIRPIYNFFLRSKHILLATVNSFFQIIKSFFGSRWAQTGILSLSCGVICFVINIAIYKSQKLTANECLWMSNLITVLLAICAFFEIKDTNHSELTSDRPRFPVHWKMFTKIAIVLFLTAMGAVFAMKKESINAIELQKEKTQSVTREEKSKRDIADTISSRVKRKEDELVEKYNKRLDEKSEQIIGHFVIKLIENGKEYDKKQDKIIDAVSNNKHIEPPRLHLDSITTKNIANNYRRCYYFFSNRGVRARNIEAKIYYLALSFNQYYPLQSSFFTANTLDKGETVSWGRDFDNNNPFLFQAYYYYFKVTYSDETKKSQYNDELIAMIDSKKVDVKFLSGNFYNFILDRFKEKFSELR
jgi:hypothetical protein